MNFIPIETKSVHNPKGGEAQPPFVSVALHTFTLNNNAIIELSKVWGGMDFSLQIFVSECGDYVAFGARKPKRPITGFPKSISSKEAKTRLNFNSVGRSRVNLELKDGMLVGKVN